jgi:ribosomal protein S25
MAALCYNLYENIVKFPGNRLLSFSSSLKIEVASWISSQVLLSAAMSGFIIVQQEGADICKKDADKTTYEQVVSFFCLIVLITIWISVFTTIIRIISLSGVFSKLKQHRQQTEMYCAT